MISSYASSQAGFVVPSSPRLSSYVSFLSSSSPPLYISRTPLCLFPRSSSACKITLRISTRTKAPMTSQQEREELDARARQGETVVPGGTGGKSLEAQEHLAEGRSRGGQTRREQLGTEGYQELGSRGGHTRKEQIGSEGYKEMGRKGGLSTMDKSGEERAAEEGIPIDESKYRTQ